MVLHEMISMLDRYEMKTRSNMAKVDGGFRDNLSQYKTGCYAQ